MSKTDSFLFWGTLLVFACTFMPKIDSYNFLEEIPHVVFLLVRIKNKLPNLI